jgi:hypothetical protein
MDNFFEIIGPIIFFVIYIVGKLVSKKGDAEDKQPAPRQRSRQEQDAEEAEYQRLEQEGMLEQLWQSEQIAQTARAEPPAIPSLSMQRREVEKNEFRGSAWDESEDSYDDERECQLKKIETTKREAQQTQSKSNQRGVQSTGEIGSSRKPRKKKSSFGSVRSSLKDPSAARSAFIYGEVLGQPISLRKTTGVPGLSS